MGVKIGNSHTDDFNLSVTDFSITSPEVQTYSVQIPGRNGLLDLTEVNGAIRYNNRTIKITCSHQDRTAYDYHDCSNQLLKKYHGKRRDIIFDSEKDYYYSGRLFVTANKENQVHSTYIITADCEPYAYEVQDRGEAWIWDSFNFRTGIIYQRDYCNIRVDGTRAFIITHNGQMPVIPVFELVSGNVSVRYNNVSYELSQGNNTIDEIIITQNDIVTFIGSGTITVHYRGGKL